MWTVALNMLNLQSWRGNKGWSFSLGLGIVLTTFHLTKVYKEMRKTVS
jgi:hypothetical protein